MIDYSELAVLAERAKQNDLKAYEQLYMKTCRIVYGIACSMVHDKHFAEDITQEVYIKVYLHLDQLKDNNSFISWLHMITMNTCQDHLRHEGRGSELLSDETGCDDVDEWLKSEYLTELFDSVISVLPEEQRRVIYLFYYRQLTVGQIAALEDCPIGTVKSRLSYARRTIKKALEDEERRSGDKLTLSPITAALSVMMSLPVAGYTLASDTAAKILASVLAAVSAAGAGDGGIHIVADITEEGNPFIFKKWLVKVPLLSVICTAAVVLVSAVLIASAAIPRNPGVSKGLADSGNVTENTPILPLSDTIIQPDQASDALGAAEPVAVGSLAPIIYDNSGSSAYLSDLNRSQYLSCAAETDIELSAPRRITEWVPDGVASEGEYFEIPVSRDWISSQSHDGDSVYDTTALDFTLMMSWDSDWLYVYTEFIDPDGYDCTSRSDEERELWYESMLQLSIAESGDSKNYQNMIVALNEYGEKRTRIEVISRYTPADEDFSVTVIPAARGDRVIYEVRVPFDSFSDRAVTSGNVYRFAMVIGWGNKGVMRHTQLAEGITGQYVGVPSKFAYLNLVNQPTETETSGKPYSTVDIALLNQIIDDHNLPLSKAPADGSSIPDDWNGHMLFGGEDNRLLMLRLSGMNVGGTLDLTGFDKLIHADLERASLEAINAYGLSELEVLLCDDNELTELILTGDKSLITLSCRNNQLTELNFLGAKRIEFLYCSSNRLSELDLSRLYNLRFLFCADNLLDQLELSHMADLGELWCECNMLTELDLSANPNISTVRCDHNLLDEKSSLNMLNGNKTSMLSHAFYEIDRSNGYITYECGCGYRYSELLPET